MLASDQAVTEFALPQLDIRAAARRALLPAALTVGAVTFVLVAGGQLHAVSAALHRVLRLSAGWLTLAVVFECVSLAGYMALLSLVAGRATPRVGMRQSAQITLAGAAATRLLPTAGAGGAAMTVWTLRRAGLSSAAAARTLLAFLVVLYSVFLGSIVIAGAALSLNLVHAHGPVALSAIPSAGALLGIAFALALGSRSGGHSTTRSGFDTAASRPVRRSRIGFALHLIGQAVRDALRLIRSGDARLVGALVYWLFDAAVLWAMLHALGSPPSLAVVALAYLVGQVANTLPLPGTVSGGMAGVLIAFGVPAGLALPCVLAYRTIAVWLPSPPAIAAIPGLRATIARWGREDAAVETVG